MSFSPILALHIAGGSVGVVSGFATLLFRKGSRPHRQAGIVFVVAMLIMGAGAAYLAAKKLQPGNFMGGLMTLYLVTTAWLTVRRRDQSPGAFDWGALAFALAIAAIQIVFGVQAVLSATGKKYGAGPAPYFIFAVVALLLAAGDVRMLLRGLSGTQRLARHLWRMCFALFAASGSIFLARPHLFPVFMRKSGMLIFLAFAPLLAMIFWLVRIRITGSRKRPAVSVRGDAYSVQSMTGVR
jgi:hypothetical protein